MSDLSSILQDLEKPMQRMGSAMIRDDTFVPSFITDDANARRRRKNGGTGGSAFALHTTERDDNSSIKRHLSWLFGDSSDKKVDEPGIILCAQLIAGYLSRHSRQITSSYAQ